MVVNMQHFSGKRDWQQHSSFCWLDLIRVILRSLVPSLDWREEAMIACNQAGVT